MPIQITPLSSPADIEGAITCVQRAFLTDPYYLWAFPSRAQFSEARNRASLRTRCLWGIKYALFHVAKDSSAADPDQVLGVGCWLPPNLAAPAPPPLPWGKYLWTYMSPVAWMEFAEQQTAAWSLWMNQFFTNLRHGGRGGLNVTRYYVWKKAQAEAQKMLWHDPAGYYFCNIVTVLPEAQGNGVGRLLMEYVLKMADEEGRKCYLESSRRVPNVAIYERMGFRLVRQMECKEDDGDEGVMLFCMMRDPLEVGGVAS